VWGAKISVLPGDPSPHILRLEGFAALAVTKVGLLTDDGVVVASVPVVNSTYLRGTGLPDTGVTAIVAFDGTGRRVYCQDIAAGDPCHTNEQRQATAPRPQASPPSEPQRASLGALVQSGESQGATVAIYKPGVAIFDLSSASARVKRVAGRSAGCLRARFLNGRWLTDELGASGQAVRASPDRLRVELVQRGAPGVQYSVPPPYDGCEINGGYGHRWNDAFGTRAPVEIPLTAVGRHFFNDRAAARDLAYFVRSRRVQKIRLSANPRAGLDEFVHRYPGRVVKLGGRHGRVPRDVIGFWIGPKTITFTTTSSTGLRLFVVAERGTSKLPSNNLADLAFVF
jgi:hypothetical protein